MGTQDTTEVVLDDGPLAGVLKTSQHLVLDQEEGEQLATFSARRQAADAVGAPPKR